MRIDQLPVASAIENADTLPFSDGGTTKQISVGNLTNSIRDNVYGAPLTASTSARMTDTSRIYVYTGTTGGGFTNGHWYYYNGSVWTDGGIYNSAAVQTDPTLTLEGVPADAKATGELKTVIDYKLAEFDVAVETFYPNSGGAGNIVTIEGTVDAPPAELVIYGKSVQDGTPAPDAPVDIVTAGSLGTLPMVSAGKNLIPFTYGTSQTVSGVTFTPISDGTVNVSGTNTGSSNANFNLFRATNSGYLPNGTYTVAGLPTDGTGLSACALTVRTNDKSGGNANYVSVPASGRTIVCTDASTITSIYISISSGTAVNAVYAPMLNVGAGAEEYSPPVGITSAIDTTPNGLPGIPVASGGNYIDTGETRWICDTIDLEAGVYTKRCGVVTLDGSENWQKGTSFYLDGNDFYAVFPGTYADAPGLCNMFEIVVSGGSDDGTARFASNGHQFLCYTNVASTASEWKAVLNNTHMTIVYPLAAPEVVQLTTAQLTALRSLRGRKGQTNLYSADPAGPEFRAEMYIDIPTYINEREPEIINAAVETVMELLTNDVALSGITVTPSPYNRFRPYFQPWIKEYTLSVVNGTTITITPHTDNSDLTVEFENIQTTTAQYYTMHIANGACELTFMGTGYDRGISILVSDGSRTVTYFINLICAQ